MNQRAALLESIAKTISDYRAGEISAPTAAHVDHWIGQFSLPVQVPLLHELDHVLKKTYFKRQAITQFLTGLVTDRSLTGASPNEFWKRAHFLDIQQRGQSQKELLAIFDEVLKVTCGATVAQDGADGGDFIYLDDVMFSGNHVGNDLEAWIRESAPQQARVHVVLVAIHTSGEWLIGEKLKKTLAATGKLVGISFWPKTTVENRKHYKDDSEVLWPATLPEDNLLQAYMAEPHKYPFEPRQAGGALGPFSSEPGRQLLERELLLAGLKIRTSCKNPKSILRPLGFSPFGLGFGSMIVTFRNCANNCPLALWWGDPAADPSHPFAKWRPLFPRKTNTPASGSNPSWMGAYDSPF